MKKEYSRFLTIAGSDSGGGAGIQADIKTASALGCYAMSVITAVTCQNTEGVSGIHVVPEDIVRKQLEAVFSDIGADAVKIGMVPTPECAETIADVLLKYDIKNIVLDPVMVATSGDKLISEEAIRKIIELLFPLSDLITPNIPETEFITAVRFEDNKEQNYIQASKIFYEFGVNNVLIKSGHIEDNKEVYDYLFEKNGRMTKFGYKKINTSNTHGTGCTLSSAIASFMAKGNRSGTAVEKAENYIHKAIEKGAEFKLGNGHGPVHHFFELWE
ncbi:MAG: bifunctional hydroxymethylpyrimidine kinase/phosphomethylpyrimidine kinase [Rikenellaceae bacterium]|nr:bifunctional hydroxymethylpyrimidine kinase/phosphomethylpyrimidine kinase [Rikenellaceae bacterium]